MHPLTFAALLAIASMAMVHAMVQFSRAVLHRRNPRRWLAAYLLLWAVIVILLVVFLGDELRRNRVIVIAFPLGWFALHALLLRFAIALRDAPPPPRRAPVLEAEEEEEEEDDEPSPHEPAWITHTRTALKWASSLGFAVIVISAGETLPAIRAIDTRLASHRSQLIAIFATLLGLGFAVFMGAIIRLVLTHKQSPMIVAGVVLAIVSASALGIVALPPGLKLLVMFWIGYALVRITFGALARHRRAQRA